MDNIESEITKKGRHRKKQLYNSILQQMEFYFSDSNLSKDRFLSKLIADDPYVDLSVFMGFNKIKKLNCSAEDICKAISKSNLIEVSEDKSKIRRKTEIKQKVNVDACTLYVENIKADANHESLKQVFSDFGNVVYVSIPKYRQARANKGFAFIEFETEEESRNALTYFEKIGSKMPLTIAPEELLSIQTHEGDDEVSNVPSNAAKLGSGAIESQTQNVKENIECERDDECIEMSNKDEEKATAIEAQTLKKRKGSTEKDHSEKRKKLSVSNTSSDQDDCNIERKSFAANELENSSDNTDDRNDKMTDVEFRKPKRRKDDDKESSNKKRKFNEQNTPSSKKAKQEETNDIQVEEAITDNTDTAESYDVTNKKKQKSKKDKKKTIIKELGLKVLSKKEWKVMRNRYLDLQKKKMREFKQHLYRLRMNQGTYDKNKKCKEDTSSQEVNSDPTCPPKVEFVPGVIVKLNIPGKDLDAKKIKNDIKSISEDIKYVDVTHTVEGEEVFVRFGSAEAAKEFCSQDYAGEKKVLEGEEENSYWEKIRNDKNIKFKKNVKKVRGRDKLLKKAEKANAQHIRFEEAG